MEEPEDQVVTISSGHHMTIIVHTRSTQDQASQHSSIDRRGAHKPLSLIQELLTVGSFCGKGSYLFSVVVPGKLIMLQWMAPYPPPTHGTPSYMQAKIPIHIVVV